MATMPDKTCSTCQHFNASQIPGKAGLCTLRGRPVYPESTCAAWEERLPFADEPVDEDEE